MCKLRCFPAGLYTHWTAGTGTSSSPCKWAMGWSANCSSTPSSCSSSRTAAHVSARLAQWVVTLTDNVFALSWQEGSGHRTFEIKRQLIADVAAANVTNCSSTLKWAQHDAKASAWSSGCCIFALPVKSERVEALAVSLRGRAAAEHLVAQCRKQRELRTGATWLSAHGGIPSSSGFY